MYVYIYGNGSKKKPEKSSKFFSRNRNKKMVSPKIHPTVVINVVGLSGNLLGENTPHLNQLIQAGEYRSLRTITPALTCSAQSTFLTGVLPQEHGVVANGWYFRDLSEVWFWRQSNKLVQAEKVWETARKYEPEFTCANLFWWYNMHSSADFSVTPRPMYPADGRKIPDIYTQPASLRDELNSTLGIFPLFHFWGPKTSLRSSEWIAQSAQAVFQKKRPHLSLVYLPHLDYNLQRLGPHHPKISEDVEAIDGVVGSLLDYFQGQGCRVIVLSEYAIHQVNRSISINRVLRENNWIQVRTEMGRELLDAGASEAFAVADHQIAHVYIRRAESIGKVKEVLSQIPGIEYVLDREEQKAWGLNHSRSGELIALAQKDAWFNYYFWMDDNLAPDYARTVDIHRKPGYDPVELFLDPEKNWMALRVLGKLVRKKLGFRTLLDLIPLNPDLVQGSHGRVSEKADESPVFISSEKDLGDCEYIKATEVKGQILEHLFGKNFLKGREKTF